MFLQRLEFFRKLRIADFIRVEVGHANACSVFYLAGAKIMQERSPLARILPDLRRRVWRE